MVRQFVDTARLVAGLCVLEREEAHHLVSVLRAAPGDEIEGFDGRGLTRPLRVVHASKRHIELAAAGEVVSHPRPHCALTLFVCISKGSRMDWTVEKAVETGASRIVPVLSARTVVRLDEQEGVQKVVRWERVACEAARQCGAAWLPQIDTPVTFDAGVARLAAAAPVWVAALLSGAPLLRDALAEVPQRPERAGWFVGPEGDFTPAELERLIAAGAHPVSLGGLILRAETAALYGLCVLGSRWL